MWNSRRWPTYWKSAKSKDFIRIKFFELVLKNKCNNFYLLISNDTMAKLLPKIYSPNKVSQEIEKGLLVFSKTHKGKNRKIRGISTHAISIICVENNDCDLKVTMQDSIYPGHKLWRRTQQCTVTAKGAVLSLHAQHYWTFIAVVFFLHTKAFWLKKCFLISLLSQNINH